MKRGTSTTPPPVDIAGKSTPIGCAPAVLEDVHRGDRQACGPGVRGNHPHRRQQPPHAASRAISRCGGLRRRDRRPALDFYGTTGRPSTLFSGNGGEAQEDVPSRRRIESAPQAASRAHAASLRDDPAAGLVGTPHRGADLVGTGLTQPQPDRLGAAPELAGARCTLLCSVPQLGPQRPDRPHRRVLLLLGVPLRRRLPGDRLSGMDLSRLPRSAPTRARATQSSLCARPPPFGSPAPKTRPGSSSVPPRPSSSRAMRALSHPVRGTPLRRAQPGDTAVEAPDRPGIPPRPPTGRRRRRAGEGLTSARR